MSALATLSRMKARLSVTETTHDVTMLELLTAATALAEGPRLARRPLVRAEAITEYPKRGGTDEPRSLRVRRWPIESVTSIKQVYAAGTTAALAAATALTEDTEYFVEAERGMIHRVSVPWFLGEPRCLQVIYTGGYVDPSTESPPEGSVQPPEDLQEGLINQAVWWWNQRSTAGINTIGLAAGGSVSLANSKIHPTLQAACEKLRSVNI